jgi:transposase
MRPEKPVLEQMYLEQAMSLAQMAKHFGKSLELVRKWMIFHNIPRRPQSNAEQWNSRKEEILFLYTVQDLSQEQIATYLGVSQSMIYKIMKRLKIPIHPPGRRKGPTHPLYKDGSHSKAYRKLIVKDQCSKCGTTAKLCIHHKNDDHYDNRLENLEILCHPCHMSHTKKAWWAAKKAGLPTPKGNGPVGWTKK